MTSCFNFPDAWLGYALEAIRRALGHDYEYWHVVEWTTPVRVAENLTMVESFPT